MNNDLILTNLLYCDLRTIKICLLQVKMNDYLWELLCERDYNNIHNRLNKQFFNKYKICYRLNIFCCEGGCNFDEICNGLYLESKFEKPIKIIPSELGLLDNFRSMRFILNSLKVLPTELGQLVNIKQLSFCNNHLEFVPTEFGKLINLKSLYLSDNFIKYVPTELGNLKKLSEVCLDYNKLSYIPTEFGNIDKLKLLWLSCNKLKTLPSELALVKNLGTIYVDKNPMKMSNVPDELMELQRKKKIRIVFDIKVLL